MTQKKNGKASHSSSASTEFVSKTQSSLPNADIFKIFTEVQWTEAFHDKYTRQLTKVYENTPFKIFVDDFICCLKKAFISNDKNMEKNVELTLDFAARFIISLIDLESEETDPFLMSVLDFLFENHDCSETAVRLHCCQFINCLLNSLGPNASLDVNVCESISIAMLERLQDKAATVRTQAVFALHRLQDPSNEHCKIIEVFLYHLTRDPSAEVRCAVINNVVIIQRTLMMILSRINDCKDDVRRDAYIVCSKVSVQKFRIKQRQMMLNCGFLDPSEKVKEFVKNKLLQKWLSAYKNDYAIFLRALNVQSEIGLEVGVKSLKVMFSQEEKCELIDYLLNRMKQKTVPYDCLNPEIVLFWRTLAEYLEPAKDSEVPDELFQKIMPDLTYFSDYIKGFFMSYNYSGSSASSDDDARNIEREFILIQLLEMTKCYDLADEFGRRNLSDLCISLLKDPQVTIKSVPIIINRLSWAMPDITERITAIVELISDLREPFFDADTTANCSFNEIRNIETMKAQLMERLKVLENEQLEASHTEDMMISREVEQEIASIEKKLAELQRKSTDIPMSQPDENIDPVVATKVLKIINEMIDSRDVTRLTPTLRSLFDNVVLPSFKKNMQNATVSCLSLETFGMFCLLDPVLAKERFIVFCFLISNGSLTIPAVKAVFDLLQKYGLKMFSLKDEDDVITKNKTDHRRSGNTSSTSNEGGNLSGQYVIPLLYSLLDSESIEVRNVAALGLCKLLLVGHLQSSTLVTKLIALWFNPASAEDPPFVQMLSLFFKSFVKTRGAQYILEKAFLPTLQIFFDASPEDRLSEIEIDNVVRLLINLTDAEFGSSLPKDYRVHNQLADIISDELLQNTRNSRERSTTLVKALSLLSVETDDADFLKKLFDKTDTLIHKYISMGEKNCQRYAVKFSIRLNALKKEVETKLAESEVCNTLNTTTVSEKKCDSMLASKSKDAVSNFEITNSNMEIDDTVKKQNETVIEGSIIEDSDKEISDSESVASSVNIYGMRRKNNDAGDDGIVIPSSDEDEPELQKLDDVFKKCSRSSSMSLTSQEDIRFQNVTESATKRSLRSDDSSSSQSSLNAVTIKGKRILRSSSSSSQSSQFNSPRTITSESSIASPSDSISSRLRYNTRSARKMKK